MKNETQNICDLNCKHLDAYSDLPNLYCNLTCELVNDGDFRYCPKNIKSITDFVDKQDKQIRKMEKEIERLNKIIKENMQDERI